VAKSHTSSAGSHRKSVERGIRTPRDRSSRLSEPQVSLKAKPKRSMDMYTYAVFGRSAEKPVPPKSRLARVPNRNDCFSKPNLGVLVKDTPLLSPDVESQDLRDLNKQFRSKSLNSFQLLKRIQSEIVGHIFNVDHVPFVATPYLRCQGEYVRVVSLPSFGAVRQLLKSIFFSKATTFRLKPILKSMN